MRDNESKATSILPDINIQYSGAAVAAITVVIIELAPRHFHHKRENEFL